MRGTLSADKVSNVKGVRQKRVVNETSSQEGKHLN